MSELRKYTPDEVVRILSVGPKTSWEWEFTNSTVVAQGRREQVVVEPSLVLGQHRKVLGRGSKKFYSGPVYLQYGPTCGAWSLANGLTALGTTPPADMMADLLNEANVVNRGKEEGLTFSSIRRKVEEYGYKNFGLGEPGKRLDGKMVKQAIDREEALLLLVDPTYYDVVTLKSDFSGAHFVCIAGYDYSKPDFRDMDALVLDSNCGKVWLPVSYLQKILTAFPRELRSFRGLRSTQWVVN